MQSNGKVKKYFDLSSKYLNDADECMRKGDHAGHLKSCGGATVTIVKAIAAQRKKTIKTHEGINFFMAEIARELNDENINNVSLIAEGLHQNFYEDVMHPDTIKKGAKTIKQFVTRMCNRFTLPKN